MLVRTARRDRNFRLSSLVGQKTRAPPLAADMANLHPPCACSPTALSPRFFLPDHCKGAARSAALHPNSSLGVDLSVVPKTLPPQHQPAIWAHCPLRSLLCPDDTVCDRQRSRGTGGHCCRCGASAYADTSADTPLYTPSNAVVVGAGACAATGVANMQAAIIQSTIVRSDMLTSLATS